MNIQVGEYVVFYSWRTLEKPPVFSSLSEAQSFSEALMFVCQDSGLDFDPRSVRIFWRACRGQVVLNGSCFRLCGYYQSPGEFIRQ